MWTSETILALAPEPAVAKAGQSLARSRDWQAVGRTEAALWGECRGSAKVPYQVAVDLNGPAFKCNCPSHKRPCKHVLGLFLQLNTLPSAAPPNWVQEWLAARARRAERLTTPREAGAVDEAAQAARAAERVDRVRAGVADCQTWLCDLMRMGLADSQLASAGFWETPAARLVDAQAPGLARRVRDLGALPLSGAGWQERLLSRIGQLHLLLEGFTRLERLPPEVQADVRTAIGWTQGRTETASTVPVRDHWRVVGRRVENEGRLRVQRLWLVGQHTRRWVLVAEHAVTDATFESNWRPGTDFEGEAAYFPSAYPLRGLLRLPLLAVSPLSDAPPGAAGLAEALAAYAAAVACSPWLEYFPLCVHDVLPVQREAGCYLRDAAGQGLPLDTRFDQFWPLLALSGGHPLTVMGEWNGEVFFPLCVWSAGRLVALPE